MTPRRLTILGTVAACAACCAPLVAPLVWPALVAAGLAGAGGAGGGWLAGQSPEAIFCIGLAIAGLAGGGTWFLLRRQRTITPVPTHASGALCHLETCGPTERKASGV